MHHWGQDEGRARGRRNVKPRKPTTLNSERRRRATLAPGRPSVLAGGAVKPFLRRVYQHQAVVSGPIQRVFLFAVLATVIYVFVLGDGGAIRLMMLRHQRADIQQHITELRQNAQLLRTEIVRLETDPAYIEKAGRERYGYILPGDRVFRILPPETKR